MVLPWHLLARLTLSFFSYTTINSTIIFDKENDLRVNKKQLSSPSKKSSRKKTTCLFQSSFQTSLVFFSIFLKQNLHSQNHHQSITHMAALNRLLIQRCRSSSLSRTNYFCTKTTETDLTRVSSALSSAISTTGERNKGRNVQWVFLGCPGVGKGTYAARLSTLLGVPHISTGDLVRHELTSRGPLSFQLTDIINQGKLISDEIIINLLSKRLEDAQASGQTGFLLDGFPRTLRQAEILEDVTDIELVINLKLREEVLIEKCLGRRICSECGRNYNVACIDIKGANGNPRMYMPPLLPPSQCESKLITRADDTEHVVKERLRIYNEMSRPVEEFYRSRGKLLEFDLPGGIPESWPKLLRALNLDDDDLTTSVAA